MRTLIGLAAVLHVATAEAECSDPLACGQRTSLMQMKSVNTKQSNDGSMHSTLMYFQTFTQKLVQQFHARRAAQVPANAADGILQTDTNNQDHILRDADRKKQFVKLDDATHATWAKSSATDDTYDKTTLETVRNVMDTIRETLLGALIQNLDNALVRVGQCQLLEAYDGATLEGHQGYHVGYFAPLPCYLAPGERGCAPGDVGYAASDAPHKRRMRKRISTSRGDIMNSGTPPTEGTDISIANGLTFDQRAMGGVQTVHQFCFAETFTPTDLTNLDTLWDDSETERKSHKTCRGGRSTSCVGQKKPHCEAYDNYRWYDPAARLETHACSMYDNDPAVGDYIPASHAEVFRTHLSATDDRKVNKMEECLRTTKTWLEDLYTYYKHCNRAGTDECHNKREVCDAKQHDFEVARCWWAVDHDYHCTSYEHCVKNRLTACIGVCEDLSDYLASTKRDYSTGETIQCLLESLFGRYNTAYDTSGMALPYKTASGEPTNDEFSGDTANDRNDAAWPLIPRGETDDEKQRWLEWCSYDSNGNDVINVPRKSVTEVMDRYYHNNWQEYPWYTGAPNLALSEPPTLQDVSFTEIKMYEAEYFTVRCRGGSQIRNARRHPQDGTHRECSGPAPSDWTKTGTGNPALETTTLLGLWNPWECSEAFSNKATVASNFGLDRSVFLDPIVASAEHSVADRSKWSWANPSEAGSTKYDQWPGRTEHQPDHWTLNVQEITSPFKIVRPTEDSLMGTVLYLTYLEKFHELPSFKRLFDCSQEPVPGEWTTASGSCHTPPPDDSNRNSGSLNVQAAQGLTQWPHFGCFADVYRVDSLRTDVPACDIDVEEADGSVAKTFWLSHASNMKYGIEDNTASDVTGQAKNPDALGCGNAESLAPADHSDRAEAARFGCEELVHDPKSGTWDDNADLYGTCCNRAAEFWEPIPSTKVDGCTGDCELQRQTEYECKNHYMFTYAERELALGLEGRGFHDDSYATDKGFFKAQRHNLIADNYRAADGTSHTTASLSNAMRAGVGVGADNDGDFDSDGPLKTPWTLSSDIQGAYTVVSTTASLGTACTFRHATTSEKYVTEVDGTRSWNTDKATIQAKAVRSADFNHEDNSIEGSHGMWDTNGGISGDYRYQNHADYSGANL